MDEEKGARRNCDGRRSSSSGTHCKVDGRQQKRGLACRDASSAARLSVRPGVF